MGTSKFLNAPQIFLYFFTCILETEKYGPRWSNPDQLSQLDMQFKATFLCKCQAERWFCKILTKLELKAVELVCADIIFAYSHHLPHGANACIGSKTFATSQSHLETVLKGDGSWPCKASLIRVSFTQLLLRSRRQVGSLATCRCDEEHGGFVPPMDARETSWDTALIPSNGFGRHRSNRLKWRPFKEVRHDASPTRQYFKWWAVRSWQRTDKWE